MENTCIQDFFENDEIPFVKELKPLFPGMKIARFNNHIDIDDPLKFSRSVTLYFGEKRKIIIYLNNGEKIFWKRKIIRSAEDLTENLRNNVINYLTYGVKKVPEFKDWEKHTGKGLGEKGHRL